MLQELALMLLAAFGGSRIRELIVDHQMVIENGAFANNQFFRKVVIYDTASTIMSGAFENTKTRYLEVHQVGCF